MFGFISRQAYSVSAQRRPAVAVDTMVDARRSSGGPRQALGLALVSIGQRVAGEMPAAPAAQPDGECA
jgi:hypothetical protein